MTDTSIDETELMEFLGHVVGDIAGAATVAMVCLGEELGLYRAMAASGPCTASDLAAATGCHVRLVDEWLHQQEAAGYVRRHDGDGADRYVLPLEHAMVVADPASPAFVAAGQWTLASMFRDLDAVATAFRGDGSLPWGDHDACLFRGVAEWFRPTYEANLTTAWIPALDGVAERLIAGGRVADVGCGHGYAALAIADGFASADVVGFDPHVESIATARRRAVARGLADRVRFEVADASTFAGRYDLVLFGDCLHDMGDPVAAARHALAQLGEHGSVMVVEPLAAGADSDDAGLPTAQIFYAASTCICTPGALSQAGGWALGAQSGEQAMTRVFEAAGAGAFRCVAETPFNAVFEAKR